jgi:hypothetical protein
MRSRSRSNTSPSVDSGSLAATLTLMFRDDQVHDRRKRLFSTSTAWHARCFSILDEEVTDATLQRIADKIKSRLMDQAPVLKISQPVAAPLEIEVTVSYFTSPRWPRHVVG